MTFIIAETIKYLVLQRRGNITYPVFTKFQPKKKSGNHYGLLI